MAIGLYLAPQRSGQHCHHRIWREEHIESHGLSFGEEVQISL